MSLEDERKSECDCGADEKGHETIEEMRPHMVHGSMVTSGNAGLNREAPDSRRL
jgi:hypothetical protein